MESDSAHHVNRHPFLHEGHLENLVMAGPIGGSGTEWSDDPTVPADSNSN